MIYKIGKVEMGTELSNEVLYRIQPNKKEYNLDKPCFISNLRAICLYLLMVFIWIVLLAPWYYTIELRRNYILKA